MQTDVELPLRERKKAMVRKALISAACRLFETNGYERTTLDEICTQCHVTVQTLLRYFKSKEDLALARIYDALAQFKEGLDGAVKARNVIGYWREFVVNRTLDVTQEREWRLIYRLVDTVPSLAGRFLAVNREYELLMEDALCREAGVETGSDLYLALKASLLVAGTAFVGRHAIGRGELSALAEACKQSIDFSSRQFVRPRKK